MLWHSVLDWPKEEYQPFLAALRKAIRNKKIHGYFLQRYAYARKPVAEMRGAREFLESK